MRVVSIVNLLHKIVLLGVEYTWTVCRIPYYLHFRLDPLNRREEEGLSVPAILWYSESRKWKAWQVADHARTNNISQDDRFRESDPLNFVRNRSGYRYLSRYRTRRILRKRNNLVLFPNVNMTGLSEMATNRESGYIVTRKYCTNRSNSQGNRKFLDQNPLILDTLLAEIKSETKCLTPLLRKCMDDNDWPMFHHSKALIELKSKKQMWICLAAGKYGVRSIQVETQFSEWLCSLDMRVSAVETVYRSRGNRSPGIDGNILTRENLLSHVNALSFNQLFKYKASPIRRVFIPKSGKAELRPLGIPTINDRCMQTLFVQLLDPIIESVSDDSSYGFRKGRNAHQAIGDLSNHLRTKPQLKRPKTGSRRYFSHSKYVYSLDIKGFFNNVSHDWLVENVPIPLRFREVWSQWLTSEVYYQGNLSQVLSGFPQGSVIGPLLANFTLNGFDELCQPTQKTAFDCEKSKFLREHYGEHYKQGQSIVRKTLVQRAFRYADDIVIVSNDMPQLSLLKTRIDSFLEIRGLEINTAKSFFMKWENNQKFDFLGFTFHYILNPVQSKITEQRTASGELILRGGLYVYPSDLSVSSFKHKIKSVIRLNLNSSPFTIVKVLNPIIRGWGNYFGIGTLRVFSRLDHFIYYRLWRYLRRKFKKVRTGRLIERFFQGIPTPSGRLWQFHGTHVNQSAATKLRKGEVQWLLLLCKLNTPVPAHTLKTNRELRSTSKYVDSSSHVRWNEHTVTRRSQTTGLFNNWTELYKRQKGLCPICNTSLGYLLEDNLEIHHVGSIAKAAKSDPTSYRVNWLDNLMLVHKTCHKGLHR